MEVHNKRRGRWGGTRRENDGVGSETERRGGKEGGGRRFTIRGERRMGEMGRDEQGGVGSKQKGGATGMGEQESRR